MVNATFSQTAKSPIFFMIFGIKKELEMHIAQKAIKITSINSFKHPVCEIKVDCNTGFVSQEDYCALNTSLVSERSPSFMSLFMFSSYRR